MGLRDKVCVVTGASSGIGRRTALDLAALGARVCVAARRQELLESLVEEMGGEGAGHSLAVVDVSKRTEVRAMAAHVSDTYGRLDVLVNNAGFSRERPLYEKGAVADLEKVMKTNFNGAVYCTAELLPLLLASSPSHVVNVASMGGRLAMGGSPAYCASKFAMVGWSEALHFQLESRGVCVSVVEPGLIPTEGFPQEPFKRDPLLKYTLGSTKDVSEAIVHAIRKNKMERVVPRWYYLLQVPRLLAPPLYRAAQRRLVLPRQKKLMEERDAT
jgi:uncharacterized protein